MLHRDAKVGLAAVGALQVIMLFVRLSRQL
jgi:hypothetical protein